LSFRHIFTTPAGSLHPLELQSALAKLWGKYNVEEYILNKPLGGVLTWSLALKVDQNAITSFDGWETSAPASFSPLPPPLRIPIRSVTMLASGALPPNDQPTVELGIEIPS
jgi:hypothetical protein